MRPETSRGAFRETSRRQPPCDRSQFASGAPGRFRRPRPDLARGGRSPLRAVAPRRAVVAGRAARARAPRRRPVHTSPARCRADRRAVAPAHQRGVDAGWPAAGGSPRASGRAARTGLHGAVLEPCAHGAHDPRRQLRTPSRMVSLSARRAAAHVLPAVRLERQHRDHGLEILRVGDQRRLRYRSGQDRGGAARRRRDVRQSSGKRGAPARRRVDAVRAARRRSARTAQPADGGHRGAGSAAPRAGAVVAVAGPRWCGQGSRRGAPRAGAARRAR